MAIAAAAGSCGTLSTGPEAVAEKTTLRDVMNESTGAIGLIERTL